MSESLDYTTRCDLPAMQQLARQIASVLHPQDCLCLHGTLGAGKTSFAQACITACCGDDVHVSSPSFGLMQSYAPINATLQHVTLWHVDLYRLEHPDELQDIGLDEAIDTGITLIEWPEIAKAYLPDDALHITFAFAQASDYRDINIQGDITWNQRLCLL